MTRPTDNPQRVLAHLSQGQASSLAQIADALGIAVTTVDRIIRHFAKAGMVDEAPKNTKYYIWRITDLGRRQLGQPMPGKSGIVAPLTYRQQIVRERLAAVPTTIRIWRGHGRRV